jgi:predicted metal-dependent hydrolase
MQEARALSTTLNLRGCVVSCQLLKHPDTNRYIMRFSNGAAHITIPQESTFADGLNFAKSHQEWLIKQVQHQPRGWKVGTEFLFRGEVARIKEYNNDSLKFKNETIKKPSVPMDLRPLVEQRLKQIAAQEFPLRVKALSMQTGITCGHVVVKDQRSRWGSSSSNGTISLNWRLVQTPLSVLNYVIYHELAHQREMNHSARFWAVVESICPDYRLAEQWLRSHPSLFA